MAIEISEKSLPIIFGVLTFSIYIIFILFIANVKPYMLDGATGGVVGIFGLFLSMLFSGMMILYLFG